MKFLQIISLISILSLLLVTSLSFAQVPPPEETPPPEIPTTFFGCEAGLSLRQCLLRILGTVLRVILVIALAFAAVMIAWAGVEYILRSGEGGEKQTKVKTKIIFAAVGLVVAFLAWVMTAILSRIISGGTPAI